MRENGRGFGSSGAKGKNRGTVYRSCPDKDSMVNIGGITTWDEVTRHDLKLSKKVLLITIEPA